MTKYTYPGPFGDYISGVGPAWDAPQSNAVDDFLAAATRADTEIYPDPSVDGLHRILSLKPDTPPVTVNGTTSGTAQLYQFMRGTIKAFYLNFNNYRNSSTTEQFIVLPTAFVTVCTYFASGGIPQSKIYNGPSTQVTSQCKIIISFPTGSGAGNITTQNTINGFQYGEITAAFDRFGLGTSHGQAYTANLFGIGL